MKLASLLAERCNATWLLWLHRTFLSFVTFFKLVLSPLMSIRVLATFIYEYTGAYFTKGEWYCTL